jgi:hypothetical protein
LPFSPTATQYAGVNVKMPRSWSRYVNINVTPIWLSLTPNGGNVYWVIYANGISNAETCNWSAASGAACVQSAYGQYLITSAVGVQFPVASPANPGDYVSFLIIREGPNGGDTYPDNALFLGLGLDIITENDVDA